MSVKTRRPLPEYKGFMTHVLNQGEWVSNGRTNKRCLTAINYDLQYNVGAGEFPLDTTRKSFWRSAVDEMCSYLRGCASIKQLHGDFGVVVRTWDANASAPAWLDSPHHNGEDGYLGRIYGVQGNDWKTHVLVAATELNKIEKLCESGYVMECTTTDGRVLLVKTTNQLKNIYDKLKRGEDDRGLILNFYNPGEVDQGCLRPCMYSHQFSLLNKGLYLNSTQRSADIALGVNFNMVQVYFLLYYFSWVFMYDAKTAYHKMVNCHFYEDQMDTVIEQVSSERKPLAHPIFRIKEGIKRPETFEEFIQVDSSWFEVEGYESHPPIKHKFTV